MGNVRRYTTAPYLAMLFASLEFLVTILDLSILQSVTDSLIQFIHIILLVSFVWVAGTLPLNAFRPDGAAKPEDVRYFLVIFFFFWIQY